MNDPVDTVAPWTIKAVAVRTRETVIAAARREGLTVGQWLERRVREWEDAGGPTHVEPAGQASIGDMAALIAGTRSVSASLCRTGAGCRGLGAAWRRYLGRADERRRTDRAASVAAGKASAALGSSTAAVQGLIKF